MRLIAVLSMLALVVSCGQRTEDAVEFDGTPTCGAEALQHLLGQPEAVLSRVNLPRTTRILRPDDVIALDFSPDRLTIDIDGIGRISSITCR